MNKYQAYLNREYLNTRARATRQRHNREESRERFANIVGSLATAAGIIGGVYLVRSGKLGDLLGGTLGEGLSRNIGSVKRGVAAVDSAIQAISAGIRERGLLKFLGGESTEYITKKFGRIYAGTLRKTSTALSGTSTMIENMAKSFERISSSAEKSIISHARLNTIIDSVEKQFGSEVGASFKASALGALQSSKNQGLFDTQSPEQLLKKIKLDKRISAEQQKQIFEHIQGLYNSGALSDGNLMSPASVKEQAEKFRQAILKGAIETLTPKKESIMARSILASGGRYATAKDIIDNPDLILNESRFFGVRERGISRAKESIKTGQSASKLVHEQVRRFIDEMVANGADPSKIIIDPGVLINKAGEVVDIRGLQDVSRRAISYLSNKFAIPFVNINPLNLLHFNAQEAAREAPMMTELFRGEFQPVITGTRTRMEETLVRVGSKLYNYSGEVVSKIQGGYLTSNRYGTQKEILEAMAAVGETPNQGILQEVLDIGGQRRTSEIRRAIGFFRKFNDPDWLPNKLRDIEDEYKVWKGTKGAEFPNRRPNEAIRQLYSIFNRHADTLDTDTIESLSGKLMDVFKGVGFTPEDFMMETEEDVMLTLSKYISSNYVNHNNLIDRQLIAAAKQFRENPEAFFKTKEAVYSQGPPFNAAENLQFKGTFLRTKVGRVKRQLQQQFLQKLADSGNLQESALESLDALQQHKVNDLLTLNWLNGLQYDIKNNTGRQAEKIFADVWANPESEIRYAKNYTESIRRNVRKYNSRFSSWVLPQTETSEFGDQPYLWVNKAVNPFKATLEAINESLTSGKNMLDAIKEATAGTFSQFFAGRKNLRDVTTATMFPYYFMYRLNTGISTVGLGLSEHNMGSAQQIFANLLARRYGATMLALGLASYLAYEIGNATGKKPQDVAAGAYVNMTLGMAKVKDIFGITNLSKWTSNLFPGSERLWQNPIGAAIKYGTFGLIGDDRSMEELKRYYQKGSDPIRSGRWWGIGSTTEFRGCLTPESKIQCRGGMVSAKDIRFGDLVLTKDGTYHPITAIIPRDTAETIYKVTTILDDSETVWLTGNHQVLAIHTGHTPEWVPVENITLNDYMLYPIPKGNNDSDTISIGGTVLTVNKSLGRLVGLYTVTGHCETGTASIFKSLVPGENQQSRHLSNTIMDLSNLDFWLGFIEAFETTSIEVANYRLAKQIQHILLRLYIVASISTSNNAYRIDYSSNNGLYKWADDDTLAVAIKSIGTAYYKGVVYDFSVDTEPSFVSSGYIMHNSKISYFAPNWYRRMKSDYMMTDVGYGSESEYWANNWLPTPRNPLGPIKTMILDPNHWQRKHLKDRPAAVIGGVQELQQIPLVGPLLDTTIGRVLNPRRLRAGYARAHRQYINRINEEIKARYEQESQGGYYEVQPGGGLVPVAVPDVIEAGDEDIVPATGLRPGYYGRNVSVSGIHITDEVADSRRRGMGYGAALSTSELSDINASFTAGSRVIPISPAAMLNSIMSNEDYMDAFLPTTNPSSVSYRLGEAKYSLTELAGLYGFTFNMLFGGEGAASGPVLQYGGDAWSIQRAFWDMGLGGFPGELSEIGRRFIPKKRTERQWSPFRNTMPEWLPMEFQYGDPFTKIARGEARLPGSGYESLNQLHPDMFGEYGAIDRFKILADIAPYSEQYKYYSKILTLYNQAGLLSDEEKEDIREIKHQVHQQKQRYDMTPYKFLYAHTQRHKVKIKEVIDDITFIAEGYAHPMRLAGITMPPQSDTSPGAQEAREYLRSVIRGGATIWIETDADPLFAVRGDVMQTMRVAVFDQHGESVSSKLARTKWGGQKGVVKADYKDTRATTVRALYSKGEITVGKVWELLVHRNNPFNNKFMQVRSPYEQYVRRMVYGKDFRTWQHPIKGFIQPIIDTNAMRNPILATAVGALGGSLFGRRGQTGAKLIGAIIGGAIMGGASSLRAINETWNRITKRSDYTWIPKRRRLEREINEYFDRLTYIKYKGLYERARELARKEEGVDVEELAKSARGGKAISKRRRKALEARKRWVYTNMANPLNDPDVCKAELQAINEELGEVSGDTAKKLYRLGPLTMKALEFKGIYESTLYGATPSGDLQKIIRALPKTERDFFSGFLTSPPEEREKILRVVPQNERRFLQAMWGLKPDKVKSNEEYFMYHNLPGPLWEGWKPDVSLEAIKLNTAKAMGLDVSDLGFYPSDVSEARGAGKVYTGKGLNWFSFGKLHGVLKGLGLKKIDIKSYLGNTPLYDTQVDIEVEYDRKNDIIKSMNDNYRSLFR